MTSITSANKLQLFHHSLDIQGFKTYRFPLNYKKTTGSIEKAKKLVREALKDSKSISSPDPLQLKDRDESYFKRLGKKKWEYVSRQLDHLEEWTTDKFTQYPALLTLSKTVGVFAVSKLLFCLGLRSEAVRSFSFYSCQFIPSLPVSPLDCSLAPTVAFQLFTNNIWGLSLSLLGTAAIKILERKQRGPISRIKQELLQDTTSYALGKFGSTLGIAAPTRPETYWASSAEEQEKTLKSLFPKLILDLQAFLIHDTPLCNKSLLDEVYDFKKRIEEWLLLYVQIQYMNIFIPEIDRRERRLKNSIMKGVQESLINKKLDKKWLFYLKDKLSYTPYELTVVEAFLRQVKRHDSTETSEEDTLSSKQLPQNSLLNVSIPNGIFLYLSGNWNLIRQDLAEKVKSIPRLSIETLQDYEKGLKIFGLSASALLLLYKAPSFFRSFKSR
ncbi:MAG: hypothetical protein L7U87_02130 [Chlamydiales bacterium]|nr:hypothetical protein [Chlamydiales bacterium]